MVYNILKKVLKVVGGRTLEEEQENDQFKESLAIENGIKNYLPIDCRNSEMEFIKSNILKSQLNNMFDLSQIDWLECHEFACNSFVKEVCDLWNKGYGIKKIGEIIELHKSTVGRYLRQGKAINLCNNYSTIEAKKRGRKESGKSRKKTVIQLSLNGEFIKEWESATNVEKVLGIRQSDISATCIGRQKSAGGFLWIYKNDYSKEKMLNLVNSAKNTIKYQKGKPIIQLTLDGEFVREWKSLVEVKRFLDISYNNISTVCNNRRKSAGGFKWMYKEEYYQQKEALV